MFARGWGFVVIVAEAIGSNLDMEAVELWKIIGLPKEIEEETVVLVFCARLYNCELVARDVVVASPDHPR